MLDPPCSLLLSGRLLPLQSPTRSLEPGRAYTFCISARLGPGSPASMPTQIQFINTATWQNTSTALITLTGAWQPFCLSDLVVPSRINGYFALLLNVAPATFYIDDASWQYLPLLMGGSSSPKPSPSPSPKAR